MNELLENSNVVETQPMLESSEQIIFTNNNNQISLQLEECARSQFDLIWTNLSFIVEEKSFTTIKGIPCKVTSQKKKIIENQCGRLTSGKLTAFLGPNGAGKTTLLECLGGRRRSGLSGQIFVYNQGFKKDIRISYYPQNDILLDILSVEETLRYCCQLKGCQKLNKVNQTFEKSVHRFEIEKLINDFNLKKCSKNPVDKCSGGQRRRLSIALELIFSPSILLLDEPTSGLDSLSSLQCIQLVKQMTENSGNPMIIAVVIHQPNPKLLSHFDDLYVLSSTGQCIYEGPTTQLIEKMSDFGLHCSQYCNPSDFAIEIGSGDYGMDAIQQLADYHNNGFEENTINIDNTSEISKIINGTRSHAMKEQILMTRPLIKRCLLMSFKDPKQYVLQFFTVMLMLILLFLVHLNYKIGTSDPCLQRPSYNYMRNIVIGVFDILNPTNSTFPNMAFLFYSMLFVVFVTMLPTLLSFPLEMPVLRKEYLNGWYSLSSYFMSKNIADLPQNFIFPVIYSIGSYIITEQVMEFHRFFGFTAILVLLSILSQGLAFLISALFVNNVLAATIIGAAINIPLVLFSGLLIKLEALPLFIQYSSYLSYFRQTYELLIVMMYGFSRCQPIGKTTFHNLQDEFGSPIVPIIKYLDDYEPEVMGNVSLAFDFVNGLQNKSVSSLPIIVFGYNESNFLFNIIFLVSYALVLRIVAYFILVWKIKVK